MRFLATSESAPQWRWLRLLLVLATVACAAAGQYWLSFHHVRQWSALAWAGAGVCFVLLYWLAREDRELPSLSAPELPRNAERVLFALVFGIGIFFTTYRLSTFPPGLNHDAAWEGQYALAILRGIPYTPYVSAAWGRETMTFYLQAVSIWFLGRTQLALLMPAVIGGILVLPFLYWWARNMFGARVALLATLLLGVSGWHLLFSRTGWRSDLQPLFTVITCCFFIRGMLTAKPLDFFLSGLALALTLNTYNAARPFPLLFALWLMATVPLSWHWRGFVRRYGIGLVAMAWAFGTAIAPLAWYAATHWVQFQGRARYLIGSHPFGENLKATLLMFNYWANGDDFFTTTPGLEYPTAVFLAFGLMWLVARWRDERAQFVLLGLAVNLLPGFVSNPNMNRNIGAMPFIFFCAALGVMFFARELARLIPRVGHVVATLFVLGVGASAIYATYAQYFGPHRRDVWGYYPETTVLGKYLGTIVPQYRVWVGGANFPRDTLTYFTYQGGDPFAPVYTWLDDVTMLLRMRLADVPAGKGFAFVLANEGPGPVVLSQLQRRYPTNQVVELHYPVDGRRVFAKALLVPPEGAAAATPPAEGATVEPPPPPVDAVMQAPAGKLSQPRGIALTDDGGVLVCDFGNHRIQQFGRDLNFVRQWGGRGEALGQFKEPCGIAVGPSGEIFVADTWNQRVQVFSKTGESLRFWVASFFSPRGIAVDAKGSVFVADSGNNRVVRFSPTGQKEVEWGSQGSAQEKFQEPIGIATDAEGRVYVADNGNARLQIFTRDGKFVKAFAVPGWEGKAYSEPGVAIDPKGTIWVTVPGEHEIRAYDKTGKLLRSIKPQSIPGATFETPMGITYRAATKELIISDLEGRLVRIPAGS